MFTEPDEITVPALVSAAAVAVDNAQLFDRTRSRAEWIKASRGITTTLLTGADPRERQLQLIAEQLYRLTDAEQTIVLVPCKAYLPVDETETLTVAAAAGVRADEVIGQSVPVEGSTSGEVFRSGTTLITAACRYPIPAFTDAGKRPTVVMPLYAQDTVLGVTAVARNQDQQPFDPNDLEWMNDFASHAAMALTLAAGRESASELAILSDRERIAHDLHDRVIQRLFAIGMDVQGTIARAHSPEIVDRLTHAVNNLQGTIEDIRMTIFQLHTPAEGVGGFRQRIQETVADLTANHDVATTLRMSGPMAAVGSELAEHAEAAAVEAISNAVRHSGGSRLTVEVTVADEFSIDVLDNGCGIPTDNQRQSGLANLRQRAERVGGACHISSPPEGGTRVRWTAPLI